MKWDRLAGNASAKEMLSGYIDSGRLPHALLIEGPIGSGRRTFARQIARAVICSDQTGNNPCGICSHCHKALAGSHPDIEEIEGEGKSHTIAVGTIRDLRERAYIHPNEAKKRVMIIADAQDMNEAAQNALLKVLEEPPAHSLFILTCENRSQMLSTIQSRTLCVSLGGVAEEEALPVVMELQPECNEEDARKALRLFSGIIGQAVKGLQGGDLTAVIEQTAAMAEGMVKPEELSLLRQTATLDKSLWDGVLSALQLAARDALAVGTDTVLSPSPEATATLSAHLTRQQLMAVIREIDELAVYRRRYMNATLFSAVAAARLRQAAGK